MINDPQLSQIRSQCHDEAFHCYGYSYIFKKRAERLKFRINLIKTFGVIVPAIIGSIALSYNSYPWILDYAVVIATPALIIQFAISVWAVLYKWDEELAYSYESIQAHGSLYSRFKKLGKFPPNDLGTLTVEYDKLELERSLRENQDDQHNIKDWETRMGMKWSLREHKETCIKCQTQPFSMKSTDCDVCGNFSKKNQLFNS